MRTSRNLQEDKIFISSDFKLSDINCIQQCPRLTSGQQLVISSDAGNMITMFHFLPLLIAHIRTPHFLDIVFYFFVCLSLCVCLCKEYMWCMCCVCIYTCVYTYICVYHIYICKYYKNFITFNYFTRYVIIQERHMSLVSINHFGWADRMISFFSVLKLTFSYL